MNKKNLAFVGMAIAVMGFSSFEQVHASIPFINSNQNNNQVINQNIQITLDPEMKLLDQKALKSNLSKAWKKLHALEALSLDLKIKADLNMPSYDSETGKSDVLFSMIGALDLKEDKNPKMDFKFNFDFISKDDPSLLSSGQFKMNNQAFFVNIDKAEFKGDTYMQGSFDESVRNKWWKMPIPSEFLTQMGKSMNDSNLTAAEKRYLKVLKNSNFFKSIKYIDTQNVMAEQSDHYTATLNEVAFQSLIKEFHHLNEDDLTTGQLREMRSFFKNNKITLDLYIGKISGVMNKIAVKFPVPTPENSENRKYVPYGTISFEFSAGDFDKSITVNEPANAENLPFPLVADF